MCKVLSHLSKLIHRSKRSNKILIRQQRMAFLFKTQSKGRFWSSRTWIRLKQVEPARSKLRVNEAIQLQLIGKSKSKILIQQLLSNLLPKCFNSRLNLRSSRISILVQAARLRTKMEAMGHQSRLRVNNLLKHQSVISSIIKNSSQRRW